MSNKFLSRGKREDTGNWVEGYYVELPEDQHGKKLCLIIGLDGQYNRIIPETAGRCTGLTDKNGKSIFEGDIVEVIGEDYLAIIVWDEDTARFELNFFDEEVVSDFDNYFDSYWGYEFEIVGNIHDNKQMLGRADMPVPDDVFQPVLKSATPENFVIAPAY